MTIYAKPFLDYQQQLSLLMYRGLEVSDSSRALDYLRRAGYYRLSAYTHAFRQHNQGSENGLSEQFIPGTTFDHVVDLYVFDKKLRMMLLDAIERIEVAVRSDIAYLLGAKDPFALENPNLFHANFTSKSDPSTGETQYQAWIRHHDVIVNRSRETFVEHFKSKYGLPLPIWVSIELWDFGLLSHFFVGMTLQDRQLIANKYGVANGKIMGTWLRTLNYVRNIAAHHHRLWNKNLVDQPSMPKQNAMPQFNPLRGQPFVVARMYSVLCISVHFLNSVCPESSWTTRLLDLLETLEPIPNVSLAQMGFPSGWKSHEFWQTKFVSAP